MERLLIDKLPITGMLTYPLSSILYIPLKTEVESWITCIETASLGIKTDTCWKVFSSVEFCCKEEE